MLVLPDLLATAQHAMHTYMTTAPSPTATIIGSAEWLAHRYDPQFDAFHFVAASRDAHDKAMFLTDDYLPGTGNPLIIDRAQAVAAAPPSAPVHFIFHSAYCCSTLLTRAFDIPGISMGLKEPVLLNDIVGWRHRGGSTIEGRRVAMILDQSLHMLGRPFKAGEAVVIKPSNLINPLAPAILGMRQNAQALLLHAPLETYLGSIARKGLWGRHWVRDLLVKLLIEGQIDLGFEQEDYLKLTDIQVAAVGWLAQHALFERILAQFGPERVKTLSSETLMADPATSLRALARHFRQPMNADAIKAIASGPVFTRHSKFGTNFDAEQRNSDRATAMTLYAEEIEKVMIWAGVIAKNAGISFTLQSPLID